MNQFLHGVAKAVAESFALPEPIVEVGSYQVEGQESVANLRTLFPGREFLGIDVRLGPGVDQIADVEDLPIADHSVGTVIAMSTFEHVPRFWNGFAEVARVLRPDGVFLVSVPFYFHIHNYPSDYWRFTPEALDLLLQDYPQRILGCHGPAKRPSNVWAIGFGPEYPQITPLQFGCYQTLLHTHAREPEKPGRRWRYRLGKLLCGRGPFAPFLDHHRIETELRTAKQRQAA